VRSGRCVALSPSLLIETRLCVTCVVEPRIVAGNDLSYHRKLINSNDVLVFTPLFVLLTASSGIILDYLPLQSVTSGGPVMS
jgi:hypothetical protein